METQVLHAMCRRKLYYLGEWDRERNAFIWRIRSNTQLFSDECKRCAGECEWRMATDEIDSSQLSLF